MTFISYQYKQNKRKLFDFFYSNRCNILLVLSNHDCSLGLGLDKGIGDHNYCRNPEASEPFVWCYTMDPVVRWERCDVPTCSE